MSARRGEEYVIAEAQAPLVSELNHNKKRGLLFIFVLH